MVQDGSETASKDKTKDMTSMDVPMVRQQLRAAEMLDAIRIHRQGMVHASWNGLRPDRLSLLADFSCITVLFVVSLFVF